jgi:hypothetical protein
VSIASPYGEPNSPHRRRLMGKHSTKDTRGKTRRIAAAGTLVLAAVVAITLASGVHKPAADTAGGGGGGNTGNSVTVD